ncbi:hypothetical protein BDY19DRAFT_485247 [Irpex rosettiformis]|uniref:Uncharacterized protein n=1 Tax=Irpex rosettiformis TaxID=378272 RepID=A0ACB8UDK5_9APHY|nr:hypothetical protein BDY19DRAFT_485247 [Irpex rosettiformis]
MSRHRDVRNMNIQDELDLDEDIDEGGEDDLSSEDYERLVDGLERIRAIIGSPEQSGVSDEEIKGTLYNCYYDEAESLNRILEVQARRHAAQERRDGKLLPLLPGQGEAMNTLSTRKDMSIHTLDDGGWHGDLSPITERTELTEYSRDWPLPADPPMVEHDPPMSSAASTSDYGNVIAYLKILIPSLHLPRFLPFNDCLYLSLHQPRHPLVLVRPLRRPWSYLP